MTADFLETLGEETAQSLVDEIDAGSFSDISWLEITGYSRCVISDMVSGNIDADNIADFGYNRKVLRLKRSYAHFTPPIWRNTSTESMTAAVILS